MTVLDFLFIITGALVVLGMIGVAISTIFECDLAADIFIRIAIGALIALALLFATLLIVYAYTYIIAETLSALS